MLHTWTWGDERAPPVICLHGLTRYGGHFRHIAERRLGGFRVIAPDLRGHGKSPWDPPWSLEQHVADVLEMLAALGLERAPFVGHSFGGRLILELPPAAVERAVLLDPALQLEPSVALHVAEDTRADVSFGSLEEGVDQRAERLPFTPRELVEEELREHVERGDDGRLRYRFCRSAAVYGFAELVRGVRSGPLEFPALVVLAAESYLVSAEQLAALGDVEVLRVPGGHSVLWDAYEQTADEVTRFLEDPRP
jgi:lipase